VEYVTFPADRRLEVSLHIDLEQLGNGTSDLNVNVEQFVIIYMGIVLVGH
jgi:hypothetical protein